MSQTAARGLLKFIEKSTSCFHAVETMKAELKEAGFIELKEEKAWKLEEQGKYYVTRNGSSIIAFTIPGKKFAGFQIMASHSDSPTFKIKDNPEMCIENHYVKLNVEKYGGSIFSPWFDRPLSVAGRILVQNGNKLITKLISVDKDLLLIPNLAIHMNREVNDGYKYNVQKDLLPLYGDYAAKDTFCKMIAKEAGVETEQIKGMDLFLFNRDKGSIWGANEEFVSAPKLDDLQCAYGSLQGILASRPGKSVAVHCVMDNEEVGSGTKQGANSTFLSDVLQRINLSLGRTPEEYQMALASSFMISADNAHAVHPNYADKADPTNRPYINEGIVIKHSANQKYTTDAVSAAVMRCFCEKAEVPYQNFLNRSDMLGGSTLGNISNAHVSLNTVDIGLPQLSMHSPYETAGVKDTEYLIKVATEFFSSSVETEEDGLTIH